MATRLFSLFSKTRGRGRPGDKGGGGDDDKLYLHPPLLELRVPEPQLLFLTDLPGGVDENEWLASHSKKKRKEKGLHGVHLIMSLPPFLAIGFFEHINLLYGTISEFCTQSACPEMLGPTYR